MTTPHARRSRVARISLAAAGASLVFFVGCAYYSLSGGLPSNVHTVGAEFFDNQTVEPGLEDRLNRAISDRIIGQSQIRYASAQVADVVIRGKITSLHDETLTFSGNQATSNQVTITVQAEAWDRVSRRTIWSRDGLQGHGTYDPTAGLTARDGAYGDAVNDIAKQIVDGILSGW